MDVCGQVNGKARIDYTQDTLFGPGFEKAMIGCDETWQVTLHFFIDVDQ